MENQKKPKRFILRDPTDPDSRIEVVDANDFLKSIIPPQSTENIPADKEVADAVRPAIERGEIVPDKKDDERGCRNDSAWSKPPVTTSVRCMDIEEVIAHRKSAICREVIAGQMLAGRPVAVSVAP